MIKAIRRIGDSVGIIFNKPECAKYGIRKGSGIKIEKFEIIPFEDALHKRQDREETDQTKRNTEEDLLISCKACGEEKKNYAKGLCASCYAKHWYSKYKEKNR